MPGAKWTCATAGLYHISARFVGSWWNGGGFSETCKVIRGTTELASGVITGFIGRAVNNYTDGFGDVREFTYSDTLDLAVGDALMFVAGGPGAWGHAASIDVRISTPTNIPNLSAIRSLSDGALVTLVDPAIATAAKGTFKSGKIYVEDSSRAMGIEVQLDSSAPDVKIGDRVTFIGTVGRDANNERCITGSVSIASTPGTPVRPLGLPNKSLAGLVYGLSVTVWGKVTARTADYLYLDDGSGLVDSTGNTGIRVNLSDIAASGSAPSQSYILVKGILGKSTVDGNIVPTIYPTSYSVFQGLTP